MIEVVGSVDIHLLLQLIKESIDAGAVATTVIDTRNIDTAGIVRVTVGTEIGTNSVVDSVNRAVGAMTAIRPRKLLLKKSRNQLSN